MSSWKAKGLIDLFYVTKNSFDLSEYYIRTKRILAVL